MNIEATRDDLERAGLSEGFVLDEFTGQMIAQIAAEQEIDDLQIIGLDDPNIKEVVGAEAIAGRAYHVGNGIVVIVADNQEDFASAMGTLAEEGRHIYHRNSNGLEDSEDYASFYGRQFARYYEKNASDTPLYMIGSNLAYTKEQLGNDWEDDAIVIGGEVGLTAQFSKIGLNGELTIVRNPYPEKKGKNKGKYMMYVYLEGSITVNPSPAFFSAGGSVYVEYYPGALSFSDTQHGIWNDNSSLIDSAIKLLSGGHDVSLYIKKDEKKSKTHYFHGYGVSYNFGLLKGKTAETEMSLSSLFEKVAQKTNAKSLSEVFRLTVIEKELEKQFSKHIGTISAGVGTSKEILRFPVSKEVANMFNPSHKWINDPKNPRPKGK